MIWASFILGFSVIAFAFAALTIIDSLVTRRRRARRGTQSYWTDARILDAYERDRQAEAEAEGRDHTSEHEQGGSNE